VSDAPGIGVMLAAPVEIKVGRTVWTVSPPDQDAKARLEKLAARAALEEVRRLKGTLDADAYAEAFRAAMDALPSYRTWGAGWQRVVFDPANAHLFLWSLLQAAHPDATEEDVAKLHADAPEEVAAAYAQLLPDFFRLLLAPVLPRLDPEARRQVEAAVADLHRRLAPSPTNSATSATCT